MESEKANFSFSPYTYVRVVVMKSKLLQKEDYTRIMKMKVAEMTKFLQDSEYRKEISELGSAMQGVDLLEHALNRNLVHTFEKLHLISSRELKVIIKAYLTRYDVYNFKTILRSKFANIDKKTTRHLLITVGSYDEAYFDRLLDLESVQKVLKEIPLLPPKKIKELSEEFAKTGSLQSIEYALDAQYYDYVLAFCKNLPKQGKLFRDFLLYELDALNIKLLLRLKKEKLSADKVMASLYAEGYVLKRSTLQKLAELPLDKMVQYLETTALGKLVKKHSKALQEGKSFIAFEIDLDKYLLEKSTQLMHQRMLSVDTILGFMFAKLIEIKNLKVLLKGKQLNMKEEQLAQHLVV